MRTFEITDDYGDSVSLTEPEGDNDRVCNLQVNDKIVVITEADAYFLAEGLRQFAEEFGNGNRARR